ncbi:SDR family oxidoreductase [Thermoleophilia bacterium SCSIO 60948]|nr:SDR family oxidoreductase [Thermoleophilia bacterium SCSIO 60948]
MIAITGSTGAVGGRVAARMSGLGADLRLLVRDASRAPELPRAEVVEFAGYRDGEGTRRALEGADRLFLVSASENEDRLAEHETAVDAAVAAGVRDLVYLSFLGAAPDATFTLARDHFHTERYIRERGIGFAFMRNSMYMDFLPGMAGDDGAIRGPAGDGRFAPVHRDDVADVAVALLSQEELGGRTYDVTGADRVSFADVVAALSEARGRTIRFVDETFPEARESRRPTGAPDWEIEAWVSSYAAVREGELDVRTRVVEELTGHPPVRLADFLASV